MDEPIGINNTPVDKETEKLIRIENEKNELNQRLSETILENPKDRVAYLLNHSSKARNSDIELAWLYWQTFENKVFNGQISSTEQFRSLTKLNSLSRIRAKIQNEYKLFLADKAVRKYRGVLEDAYRNEAIDDKPIGLSSYSVYIDETGKTQNFLAVGSIWLLDFGSSEVLSNIDLIKWKQEKNIDYEFHFSDLNKNRLPDYKEFFGKFMYINPQAGFKYVIVRNSGFGNTNEAITDLTYHIIIKGIEHEHSSGRAPLPRMINLTIDNDDLGSDQLKLENIKERILNRRLSQLWIGEFKAEDSKNDFYIQATDLFTGALNRKIHNPKGSNHKDELADFILGKLNLNPESLNSTTNDNDIDNAVVFNLR